MANNFSSDSACCALWDFESGALTTDSKSTNTLTDNNTVGTDTTRYKQGSACADFESTSAEFLSIVDSSLSTGFPLKSGDTNKKISVCFWFRAESISAGMRLLSKQSTSASGCSFAVVTATGPTIGIQTGYSSGASWESHSFGTNLTYDKWYHVGATYQDSDKAWRIRIWDDTAGALLGTDATGTGTNAIYVGSGVFHIGARNGGNDPYDGLIDELVVFNDILTTDEIDQIRSGTYGSSTPATPTIPPSLLLHRSIPPLGNSYGLSIST